jgi:hypothetical protein
MHGDNVLRVDACLDAIARVLGQGLADAVRMRRGGRSAKTLQEAFDKYAASRHFKDVAKEREWLFLSGAPSGAGRKFGDVNAMREVCFLKQRRRRPTGH